MLIKNAPEPVDPVYTTEIFSKILGVLLVTDDSSILQVITVILTLEWNRGFEMSRK